MKLLLLNINYCGKVSRYREYLRCSRRTILKESGLSRCQLDQAKADLRFPPIFDGDVDPELIKPIVLNSHFV